MPDTNRAIHSTVLTELDEITLIGLTARTNNKNEINPSMSKIPVLAGKYWGEQVANNFHHRANPGVTYAVYTDYESDENGDYTYFIGEKVESLDNQDLTKYETITIPKSHYIKLTTMPGTMPDIVISAWQAIWGMTKADFGGERRYIADFEIYDQRAANQNKAVLDIYLGINKKSG